VSTNYSKVLKIIRIERGITQRVLAKELGLSTGSIYKYENNVMRPGANVIDKITSYCKENELIEATRLVGNASSIDSWSKQEEENEEGELNMNQQNRLIAYQEAEIQQLKERVEKHKSTPVQETVWNQLDFDFEAEVKLTFENFTMGRTILSISNIEIQSKILGYSVSELTNIYDINVHHKRSQKHPVDKILHTKTLKDIKQQIKSLPSLFESLKNMMGNHYIPQPLIYVQKDKSLINAIAYNRVNWREKTVNSKIKFLLND
jgi:transcriptional regulator with XRE-family HTH domain